MIAALAGIGEVDGTTFYYKNGDKTTVQLRGPCPHLDAETNNCNIYENRSKGCQKLSLGDRNCEEARSNFSLSPIKLSF